MITDRLHIITLIPWFSFI